MILSLICAHTVKLQFHLELGWAALARLILIYFGNIQWNPPLRER